MSREEKKQELAARAAWMYYVAGVTQQEIARALGLSRQVAQRLVSSARVRRYFSEPSLPVRLPTAASSQKARIS